MNINDDERYGKDYEDGQHGIYKVWEVLKELEKLKVEICVLAETQKKGRGSEEIQNYIHLYSCESKDSRHKRGKTSRRTIIINTNIYLFFLFIY